MATGSLACGYLRYVRLLAITLEQAVVHTGAETSKPSPNFCQSRTLHASDFYERGFFFLCFFFLNRNDQGTKWHLSLLNIRPLEVTNERSRQLKRSPCHNWSGLHQWDANVWRHYQEGTVSILPCQDDGLRKILRYCKSKYFYTKFAGSLRSGGISKTFYGYNITRKCACRAHTGKSVILYTHRRCCEPTTSHCWHGHRKDSALVQYVRLIDCSKLDLMDNSFLRCP